jgi:hypothetical protein
MRVLLVTSQCHPPIETGGRAPWFDETLVRSPGPERERTAKGQMFQPPKPGE